MPEKPDEPQFRPQQKNANRHTERGLAALEDSLQEGGWIGAITVAADGESFDGSARLEKVEALGFSDPIVVESDGTRPVIVRRVDIPTASDPMARRLSLAANRVQELDLEWDRAVLQEWNTEGILEGFFTVPELGHLLADLPQDAQGPQAGGGGDEFDPTKVEGPSRARRGDVWRIGPHYLMCGDAGDPGDVATLTRYVGQADLLVTSPPYGVGKEYEDAGIEKWELLMERVFSASKAVSPLWFVNHANKRTGNDGYEANTFGRLEFLFSELERPLIALRIWAKTNLDWADTPYWRHTYKYVDDYEFLALFGEKPRYVNRLSEEENTEWGYRGVWSFHSEFANLHPATFPLELPTRAIRMLTDPGAVIYDPFSGSGTTMVAAHRQNRVCMSMEISPAYCDVTLSRALAEGISPIERVSVLEIVPEIAPEEEPVYG